MAKSPLPNDLPGDYFLVVYDADTGEYLLVLDDEDGTSHNLGAEMTQIVRYFSRINYSALGNRAVDMAREFGAAQAIKKDGRVTKARSMSQRDTRSDVFQDSERKSNELPTEF